MERMPSFPEAPAADFVGGGLLSRECPYSWRSALSPSYFGSETKAARAVIAVTAILQSCPMIDISILLLSAFEMLSKEACGRPLFHCPLAFVCIFNQNANRRDLLSLFPPPSDGRCMAEIPVPLDLAPCQVRLTIRVEPGSAERFSVQIPSALS